MLLEVDGLRAGYGEGADVLGGVEVAVDKGELIALLGPNGAGKSTLLKTIAGTVPAREGDIRLQGISLRGHRPAEIARCGVYLVHEGRAVFPSLSVRDNLRMATARPERQWRTSLDDALVLFPRLAERAEQSAGTLSGGEQQMLALARAFIARPLVLLLDEPSLGLAPRVIDEVFEVIARFRAEGVSVMLVEQYVDRAVGVADRVAVMTNGMIVFAGTASDVDRAELAERYLATTANPN
jgi:branched-chain amino acid transport system ATP-binding protein